MITIRLTRFVVALLVILALPLPLAAAALDDYYLARFGEAKQKIAAAAVQEAAPAAERCGTPLRRSLRKDWALLEPATQQTLAKYLALPALSGTELTLLSPSRRFLVHYSTTGIDSTTYSWASTVAATFDHVYDVEVTAMGYQAAPAFPYDVYIQSLASQQMYGYTEQTSAVPGSTVKYGSYTVVDNGYTDLLFIGYSPLQSLQVTAAHEYHHGIQFGYNFYFDLWYGEATATWLEDEVYDEINQLYEYLPESLRYPTLSLDTGVSTSTGGGYGRWLFNRYLTEQHGAQVVRSMWEELAQKPATADGLDIPMSPILNAVLSQSYSSTLAYDYWGYAKRLYTRAWQSHTAEIDPSYLFIPQFVPSATYWSYPVTTVSYPYPSVTLPRYSHAFYQLPPATGSVTINVNRSAGIQVSAFRTLTGSGAAPVEYAPVLNGGTAIITIPADAATAEIVLLVCNPTGTDNLSATITADLTALPVNGRGDPNDDGVVNVFDALLTLQYAVGLVPQTVENSAKFLSKADVAPLNGVGQPVGDGVVNVFDALAILRHAVGLDRW